MPDHRRLRLHCRNLRLMRGDLQPVSVPGHGFRPGMIALRRVVLLIQPIYKCLTGGRPNVTFAGCVLWGHRTLLLSNGRIQSKLIAYSELAPVEWVLAASNRTLAAYRRLVSAKTRRRDRIETQRVDQGRLALHDPLGLDTGLAAVSDSSEPWVLKLIIGQSPPDPTRPALAPNAINAA